MDESEMLLNERRAEFVHEGGRLAAIAAKAPVVPPHYVERELPFRERFLLVIERQCSPDRPTSPEECHESWMKAYSEMGWKYGKTYNPEKKTHPDLVPYGQLGQLEQNKDSVFIALCEIARLWIRE